MLLFATKLRGMLYCILGQPHLGRGLLAGWLGATCTSILLALFIYSDIHPTSGSQKVIACPEALYVLKSLQFEHRGLCLCGKPHSLVVGPVVMSHYPFTSIDFFPLYRYQKNSHIRHISSALSLATRTRFTRFPLLNWFRYIYLVPSPHLSNILENRFFKSLQIITIRPF